MLNHKITLRWQLCDIKKIVLSIIASVLGLGLLSGCGGYSHDFNSSEEAQKICISKIKGQIQ